MAMAETYSLRATRISPRISAAAAGVMAGATCVGVLGVLLVSCWEPTGWHNTATARPKRAKLRMALLLCRNGSANWLEFPAVAAIVAAWNCPQAYCCRQRYQISCRGRPFS